MAPPSYTLYTPEASFRAFPVLIAAEYNGVQVTVETANTADTVTKSPVHKLPVLECCTTGAVIFSSHAAARFVAGMRRDTGLTGSGAMQTEQATIDAWMDWCAADVELPACVWFYPAAGYMPFQQAAYVL
jgi:elongation factor 1-gamma